MSGTIGAVGDNGVGVAGVDWHARIMALKFLDSSGSGYLSNAVRALNYAVANGAKVVNASFGGGGYDSAMATALSVIRPGGYVYLDNADVPQDSHRAARDMALRRGPAEWFVDFTPFHVFVSTGILVRLKQAEGT